MYHFYSVYLQYKLTERLGVFFIFTFIELQILQIPYSIQRKGHTFCVCVHCCNYLGYVSEQKRQGCWTLKSLHSNADR